MWQWVVFGLEQAHCPSGLVASGSKTCHAARMSCPSTTHVLKGSMPLACPLGAGMSLGHWHVVPNQVRNFSSRVFVVHGYPIDISTLSSPEWGAIPNRRRGQWCAISNHGLIIGTGSILLGRRRPLRPDLSGSSERRFGQRGLHDLSSVIGGKIGEVPRLEMGATATEERGGEEEGVVEKTI
ncbi:hypothetical protein Cni_G06353 [Canna indica]|uniref:Uncharacterized protein n=1 Tax=Canna indica TaxID=4628 RepID=A0AAQ3Q5V2_9LILI|nr:hypothetical protein Cni_G06353 [Canna indica]